MLSESAILLNGILQAANREIGVPRKIGKSLTLRMTVDRRLPLLRSIRARNLFVQILSETRDRYGFLLIGYVVMPEHVHLLIGEPIRLEGPKSPAPLIERCATRGKEYRAWPCTVNSTDLP